MTAERIYYEAESFWAEDALEDESNRIRIIRTAELVPGDAKSLLDVGCGNGKFLTRLAQIRPDLRIFGVDRSEAALRHVQCEKKAGEVTEIPFEDRAFDCVSCLQVIEHLDCVTFPKALEEIARVAHRYVIIGVPLDEPLDNYLTQCPSCKTIFNINLHLRSFPEAAMATLMPSDFRLEATIYPGSQEKLGILDSILRSLVKLRQSFLRKRFLSPICPVCAYSEGDITPISVSSSAPKAKTSAVRRTVSRLFAMIRPYWPKYEEKGYWIACLYRRV